MKNGPNWRGWWGGILIGQLSLTQCALHGDGDRLTAGAIKQVTSAPMRPIRYMVPAPSFPSRFFGLFPYHPLNLVDTNPISVCANAHLLLWGQSGPYLNGH